MRVIDANALVEKAYQHGEHPSVDDLFADGVDAVDVSDIDEAPTIEAEPVRHGRWVRKGQEIYCSECGEESGYTWAGASRYSDYCPNCGAKMDLEENDG